MSIALLRLDKELITQSILSISSVVRKHRVPKGDTDRARGDSSEVDAATLSGPSLLVTRAGHAPTRSALGCALRPVMLEGVCIRGKLRR